MEHRSQRVQLSDSSAHKDLPTPPLSFGLGLREIVLCWRSYRLLVAELKLNPALHLSIYCCFHSCCGFSWCSRMGCIFTETMQPPTSQRYQILLIFGWELKHDSSNESCLYFHNVMEHLHVNSNYILFQRLLNMKKISKFKLFFLYSSPLPPPPKLWTLN